jgi:hypothetical protein
MLRVLVQLFAAALMLSGLGLLTAGTRPAGWEALLFGAVLFVAIRYERWRDRAKPKSADPAWLSTGERFEDPSTGQTVEVEYNRQTGERRYKSDAG